MTIRIGFDDDESFDEQFDESGNPIVKHGDGFNEQQEKRKLSVYIPERRIQQFKDEFDCVVVNDFGDEYHLTEQERAEKNKFYEAFKKFSKFKHKYGKLDEYVVAMREALKCLDFVAKNNGVYNPDKFKEMFLKDKIYINGLIIPKFKGRDRKKINWEYLTEFILSDKPAEEIIPKRHEDVFSDDEFEELEELLFDDGELDKIISPDTDEEEKKKEAFFDVDEDEPEEYRAIFLTNKEVKKFIKAQPNFLNQIKDIKRQSRRVDKLSRFVFDLTTDDIESIAEYDRQHNYQSSSDIPVFKGNMMNDDDYNKYLLELEEYERTQIKDNYHGKLKTQEEIDEIELKQLLDKHGWNIRNLYENKEKEEKLRKIQKKEKEREKELRKKLLDVQNRRKRRMGEDVDDGHKKSNKSKKKSPKKKSKNPKAKIKREVSDEIDDFLLGSADRLDGDFKDYKNDVTDWSWSNIMNGRDK